MGAAHDALSSVTRRIVGHRHGMGACLALAAIAVLPGPAEAGLPAQLQGRAVRAAADPMLAAMQPVHATLPAATRIAQVTWSPARPPQGTFFTVRVEPDESGVEPAGGSFAGEPLHFLRGVDGAFTALAAVPVDATGTLELEVVIRSPDGGWDRRTAPVGIARREFEMRRLTVAPEFGRPQPPEIRERISRESARAMAVSRRSHDTPRMWEPPFVPPRESRITSGFGHGREFNNQITSRHMGTDFAGPIGAPIVAPARGRVALVDEFYLGGNVLYIDHGAGLVTAYLHLSAVEVEEGDIVEPGQLIARVGATGRVTGPHLHWTVRYGTVSVDGLSLLEIGL